MKLKKGLSATLISCLVCVSVATTALSAPTYKDVPSADWAYSAISYVADNGYMVGDSTGYFKPNDLIDKFETSKILAKVAGYKYTGYSAAELAMYDTAYEAKKTILAQYQRTFTKWDKTADREIAYLLYKGIYTEDDLYQFVIKDTDGTERRRALSKEEAAVFLVRIIGKASEASNYKYSGSFKDDVNINVNMKPYVYYIRDKGIVSYQGDANGNFNPKAGATRAIFASMLYKSLTLNTTQAPTPTPTPLPTSGLPQSSQTPSDFVTTVSTISGTVDKFYPSFSAVQIITSTGEKSIYKLATNVTVYVDNYVKTLNDLKEGMAFTGLLQNGELKEIKAQTQPLSSTAPSASATPTPSTAPSVSPSAQPTIEEAAVYTMEGIIKAKSTENNVKSLSIELRMLNPLGNIIVEERKYVLAEDAKVTRGGNATTFELMQIGDVAKITFYNNVVTSLELAEKNRQISEGILLEKKFVDLTSTAILVIQDKAGNKYEFRVANETNITRKNYGKVAWNQLRVGDIVDVTTEYDKLLTVSAYGIMSMVDGTVLEVHITKNKTSILLLDAEGVTKSYDVISGSVDPYVFKINTKVRLRLDSQEIDAVTVIR